MNAIAAPFLTPTLTSLDQGPTFLPLCLVSGIS